MYQQIEQWLKSERSIQSAVLFGSSASAVGAESDEWSDVDLHLITTDVRRLQQTDWALTFPGLGYRFHSLKTATGGVDKLTIIFEAGQMDLIVIPERVMRLARVGMSLGIHRGHPRLKTALNEIHVCLRSGYRFLKGERAWGRFYERVATRMEGVRLDDAELTVLANAAAVDLLWVWQKISRGELSAAQRVLHQSVAETNFRLLRELRLRRQEALPSFGLGRHVEKLLPASELNWVRVDARCEPDDLRQATGRSAEGLAGLMGELVPGWTMPRLPGFPVRPAADVRP